MKDPISLMVFFVLIGSLGLASTTFQYVVLLLLGLYCLSNLKNYRITTMSFLDLIPVLMFCCWLYGVLIALINGVEIENVFRNFFGMVIYLYYYAFLLLKIKNKALYRALVIAAAVNVSYSMYYFSVWFISDPIADIPSAYSYSNRFRSYYSTGIMVIFPVLSCLLFSKLSGAFSYDKAMAGLYKGFWFPFLIASFSIVFTTFSKGFILAFVFLFFGLVLIFVFRSFVVSKNYFSSWVVLGSVVLFFSLLFMLTPVGNEVEYMYSSEELSNNTRSIQRQYLIDEYSFEGAGLGARLESGYERDSRGYGFETTYENVIHKFGMISIVIFFLLLAPLVISIKNMVFFKNVYYSSISFGLMLYLIPSIGNPMLFSPMFVVMHILSIKFLRNSSGSSI